MTITELVNELVEIREEKGDLSVYFEDCAFAKNPEERGCAMVGSVCFGEAGQSKLGFIVMLRHEATPP